VKRRGLRHRYGRAWASESAITRPAGSGLFDVVLVDSRGSVKGILARRVSRGEANQIIVGRHS
jgi:hypothetical protein